MSDKTENQTSDPPDAHRERLEENPGTGLLNLKEEDETDDMNSHQTEIHWSLPADEDNADIVKVEITEDLCVRHQLEAPDEETSDSISPGCTDVTPSDGSAVEHRGEPYVCDHMKTEDEVPINMATGPCWRSSEAFRPAAAVSAPQQKFPWRVNLQTAVILVLAMVKIQILVSSFFKIKEATRKIYVLNMGFFLPGNQNF
ncbi:uncharacterized protein LOC128657328 isoform X2 [Bombina bombina]|uniref:uncharacterized protein LOC128657328 isoform X2 n=1 Tax=Bombina bombina TaxID=8345 RepID=UPI00235A57ED|nr:uncharacterized protein LOC128657328 isoform X2 [Bombina bombina]